MIWIKKFFECISYTIFPKICVYCKRPLSYDEKVILCKTCVHQIKFIEGLICQICGLPLPDGGAHCFNCRKENRRWWIEYIRGATEYKEPIKTLIHEFKYNDKLFYKNFLSQLLIEQFYINFNEKIDFVCCVPISLYKKFSRGYNQTELLAVEFAKKVNIEFMPNLLKRVKHTVSQFKLSREERLKNVKDIFAVVMPEKVKGKNVLIIDDVCTTGETLNQCGKVLKSAKAKKVFGYVVARDV